MMKSDSVTSLTAALFAGVCLAGMGLSSPAAGQEVQPEAPTKERPGEAELRRALPLHHALPKIELQDLTAEEGPVGASRPVDQHIIQVIYVFSTESVEDTNWLERMVKDDVPGPRATLKHMQLLSELDTFEGRMVWSAVAVPGYPKKHGTVMAGYELESEKLDPEKGAVVEGALEKADLKKVPTQAEREASSRKALRALKKQTGATFPILLDDAGKIVAALGLRFNCVLIADAKGMIQMAATERNAVDVGDSSAESDYLRRALNELLEGRTAVTAPYGKGSEGTTGQPSPKMYPR